MHPETEDLLSIIEHMALSQSNFELLGLVDYVRRFGVADARDVVKFGGHFEGVVPVKVQESVHDPRDREVA